VSIQSPLERTHLHPVEAPLSVRVSSGAMRPRGTFKIRRRRELDPVFDPAGTHGRTQRILDSLRTEILEAGGGRRVRIRRVLQTPREIYRLELEVPDLGYQRITLLDRDALEDLLATDDVRSLVRESVLGS
jgi:hypothetical protein